MELDAIKLLIERRKELGLSQRDIAKKMKCHQSKISKIENAKDISLDNLNGYAQAVGLKVITSFQGQFKV